MRMVNAYINVIQNNYFQFHGRMARSEFWWFVLMNFLIALALSLIIIILMMFLPSSTQDIGLAFIAVYSLALMLPSLGAQVRRLHDIGISGWWLLINLVPYIGGIALLIMLILPAKPSGEKYGNYRDSASS
ncbi:MAG: DUF805 domain-containing protein [Acidithiobacillus sp.]